MNTQISKILVGIDFSDSSLNALETAVSIAKRHNADIYILYSRETILEKAGIRMKTINAEASNSTDILNALANDINRKFKIRTVVVEDEALAIESILSNIVTHKCDLAIIGNYGTSGYRNGYIGTTAYNVIKFAPCPILLVPPGKKWSFFKKSLLPVRPIMTALRHYQIIRNFLEKQSTLEIFGLSYPNRKNDPEELNEILSEMEEKLRMDEVFANVEWNKESSIPQNILTRADQIHADLVILTPAIDVSINQFYIGPNTHYIIHNAKTPVLVINKIHRHTPALARTSL